MTASESEPPTTGEPPAATGVGTSDKIDTSVPHPARRYDYWLGGKDNFAADRKSGDAIATDFPTIRLAVLENRYFMRRAVQHLAGAMGIRQFLDVGTGIPTSPNLHEIAQGIAPDSRVVYTDNDPIVMAHSRALLTSNPHGAVAYIEADLRDPQSILTAAALRETLDFGKPIALSLIAVLHFLTDQDDPYGCVARLIAELPSGSLVVLSHADETLSRFNAPPAEPEHGAFRARTKDEVGRFLQGLEPIEPGIVSIVDWFADQQPQPGTPAADTAAYGAVARVP